MIKEKKKVTLEGCEASSKRGRGLKRGIIYSFSSLPFTPGNGVKSTRVICQRQFEPAQMKDYLFLVLFSNVHVSTKMRMQSAAVIGF